MNVVSDLVIDQSSDLILAGESLHEFVLVLIDAPFKVIGHACIERVGAIGHDVHVVLLHVAMIPVIGSEV